LDRFGRSLVDCVNNIKTLEDQKQRERSFLFADKPPESSSKGR
jgi:hypothetical protein